MLFRVLASTTTVALIGSGVTIPFGYPSWQRFTTGVLVKTVEALEKEKGDKSADLKLMQGIQSHVTGRDLDQNESMFLIGTCKRILHQNGLDETYRSYLQKTFARGRRKIRKNPFKPLLDLPIHRFVTTNYDCEIERALIKKWSLPPQELGLDESLKSIATGPKAHRRSFTQRKEGLHQLARFALAGVPGNEHTVFHCHGRFDDPESIIATEEDYQRLYLAQDEEASLAFQQSIGLVLGSNPVLFIGYGLRDEDLLRPLRQLIALDPNNKGLRPIFALMERVGNEDDYRQEALFDRYGLHVIPYQRSRSEGRTSALCRALRRLGSRLREAQKSWLCKPKLKKPAVMTKKPLPHREVHSKPLVPPAALSETPSSILQPGISVLVGPSGAGKSFHAQALLEIASQGKAEGEPFAGAFYWNAHYANEALTGVDYALSYFDPKGELGGPRYERIRECLLSGRYLLVIDGCERMLRKGEQAGTGVSYSATFRRLLHVLADPKSRSTVLLVSRLWITDLDALPAKAGKKSLIRRIAAQRISAQELRERARTDPFAPFAGLDSEQVSALCSLLRGHHFGLELACRYLGKNPPPGLLQDLNVRLAKQLPDERLREMFRIAVDSLDRPPTKGLARAFLERLGLFLSPICRTTLQLCYRQARAAVPHGCLDQREPQELYCQLSTMGLLLPMGPASEGAPAGNCVEDAYTVHATARRLLFQPAYGLAAEPLPAFGLSGFTSGRIGVDPDRSRCEEIGHLFDKLLEEAQKPSCRSPQQLCRDAFGLLRTRMEANTVPRWSTYGKYLKLGIRAAQLTSAVSRTSGFWSYCEHPDARDIAEHQDAPLYAAELAWLYNDTALALSAEGHIADAHAAWEQAYEISRLIEPPRFGGGFHLEILLGLTGNSIDMGRLPAAKSYLADAERLLLEMPDDDYTARILGLRGLLAHLSGDLRAADDAYDRCLAMLREGSNLRAQSVFLKHKADIKIVTGECTEADLLIRNSRAIAEGGVFPELVANVRISEGHRLFRMKETVRARLEYNAVLKEAQRIGLRKLEARVLTALARLALDQKDAEVARDFSTRGLRLANELGLGLRQSHCLVVLGLAILETGPRELGVAYLRQAKGLADSQEYWARSREAENKLLELGLDPHGSSAL
jgi:tetratricopeptide (TPR) repeat protein